MTQAIKRQWMLNRLKRRYSKSGMKRLRFASVGDVKHERKKRETTDNDSQNSTPRQCIKRMENVENLRHIREYIQTANDCLEYLKEVGETNAKFLSTNMQMPVTYRKEKLQSSLAITQLEQFVNDLENKELSFLSPKILNVLPTKQNTGPQHLFSPTILSFEDEGLAPLPKILSLISTNQCEIIEWLDLFIHMTGASHRLRQLLQRFEPDMRLFNEQIHPKVEKLRKMSATWSKFGKTMTAEQKEHMERYGYAPMNEKQIEMAYERKENTNEENANEFLKELKEDKNDQLLENLIGELAQKQTSSNRRRKRDLRVAAPSAFTTTIAEAVIFQNNVLSPSAFSLNLLRPRAIGANILEARTFIASIMAPNMLLARIMYPSAFRLVLMTPHMLNTYILVPEAFLVLSPSFLSINDDFLKNGTVSGTDFVKTFNESAKKGLLG
ncbi:hypothetical protein M3Y97_00984200 [Aphelenchoides bicaudatus]|nr:hypothetical protein M3Y97_00984200 [Aphelenchoides bicaudatus]